MGMKEEELNEVHRTTISAHHCFV